MRFTLPRSRVKAKGLRAMLHVVNLLHRDSWHTLKQPQNNVDQYRTSTSDTD